jgi:hypothetical protein
MTIIWFNLLLFHAGHIYWLGVFETYEQCREVQLELEKERPQDNMVCRWIKVEST